ncbi:hypothetical protein LZ32DRAFT_622273 [Colletotrichum eremochloae]|nr:hypothetical protein LZ32DRAFT_622273 [Colletotrichum eremochloae]
MRFNLDNIYFYHLKHRFSMIDHPKEQDNSAVVSPPITDEVATHPKIGSCTHHGDASSSTNSGDFASEIHLEMFGRVHAPNETNSGCVSGDSTPMKTPAVLEEPKELGLTRDTRWEQQTASSRGTQKGNFPAWLECRSLKTGKDHTQAVSEPATTVSEMPYSVMWSTGDEPMSPVSSPSVTSSPLEDRYGVTATDICQAVLGRITPGKTTAPSVERPLGNPAEPEPEATVERYSAKYRSSPAPPGVISPNNTIHVSSAPSLS